MATITDISRYLKSEHTTENVTITAPATFRIGFRVLHYFTGVTDSGEEVAVYASGRSVLLNCLNPRRIRHLPRLRLTGCLDRAKGAQPRFPRWFPMRVIYCDDAEFADAGRRAAFDAVRSSVSTTVGARMDAILKGGDGLLALVSKRDAA